nr:baseplate J/gp47 family protein [Myxacorys almedinensis]
MVGGVVNEPIRFDVKVDLYRLAKPAQDIRSITSTITNPQTGETERYTFKKAIDYVFSARDNAVIWQQEGTLPDDETVFYVDYFLTNSSSPITDINVGSVTRTIGEAIGREIATVYQQINQAYLAGFIDTATGKSLDLVVAILGVTRKTKDFAQGLVSFLRDPAATDGNITIPEGTLLRTAQGITFVTAQAGTLQRGQVRIDLAVLAGEGSKGNAGLVNAGEINTLAQPIAGIASITNFEPTILGGEDETDVALRSRAKAALRGLGKGTLAAIAKVIFEQRGALAEVSDPNSALDKRSDPGKVVLLVESEPERFAGLRAEIEQTRAAGVHALVVARYIFFKPRIVAKLKSNITATGDIKVVDEMIAALQGYVNSLSSGQPAVGKDMLNALKQVKDLDSFTIVDAIAWQTEVGRDSTETLVDAILDSIQNTPPADPQATRSAIAQVVQSAPSLVVPTGKRTPNRNLVVGASGQRATDSEIEAGEFSVVTPAIANQNWWIVLDLERADIVLQEG